MTTVEKLLVQIFERKNSIIEQVKQQTELYNQHLASKLLIDGITPPSWLWNPSTSSDSKELNKEELISKLLRPYPQPSVRCSAAHYPVYNNLVVTGDNEEFSDGVFMGNLALNKCLNRQDDPTVPAISSENHVGCAHNSFSDQDASVTSPEDQTDERILNIYNAPDQSLAGIQRSKSRQKALELRNSAKTLAKGGLSHENICDVFSSQIRFSLSAGNQAVQKDELPNMVEPSVIGSQSCQDWDLDEADCQGKGKGKNMYSGRITRSRSYAKVPVSVRGSLTLGCSSEDCEEDASCHDAKVRRRGSLSISDCEQADNYANKLSKTAGPSTFGCHGCGDRTLDGEDCLSKDKGTDVYTGSITKSKISSKHRNCACDSSKANSSSDDCQRIDIAMTDSGDDLPRDYIDGSLVRVNPFNVLNEGCEVRDSITDDCKSHRDRGAVASGSSSQQNACVNEITDLDVPPNSAEPDGGILAPSSGRSALQDIDSNEVMGLVKPSVGLFRRVTRSQIRCNDTETSEPVNCFDNPSSGGTMPKSECKPKSAANDEIENASSGQFIPPSYVTLDMLDEPGNAGLVKASELVFHDHDGQSGSSSSNDAKQRRESESPFARAPPDSFVFVEPKQLNFEGFDEYSLKTSTSNSGKRRLNNSPENMACCFSAPSVSLDKVISGTVDQLSLGKKSPEKSDVSSKGEGVQRDSLESDVQETLDRAEKYGPVIREYIMLKSSEDNTEDGLNCKNSEVQHKADIVPSKMVDIRIHPVKLHLEHERESLPERQIEEGDWGGEGKDKGPLVSNTTESENLRPAHCLDSVKELGAESRDCLIEKVEMTNPVCAVFDKIKPFPEQESQILSRLGGEVSCNHADLPLEDDGLVTYSTVRSPYGENLSLEKRFRHASMESWPQLKRRKIEHQQTHCFTTSPSFRVRKPHSVQRGPASTYVKNIEINIDTVLMDTFDGYTTTDMEICQEMDSNLTEGIESTSISQNGEVGFCLKEKNEPTNSSSVFDNDQLGAAVDSSLTKNEARNSLECIVEGMRTPHSSSNNCDAREPGDRQCSQHLGDLEKNTDNHNSENLTLTNTMVQGIQSPKWEGGLQTQRSVLSPSNKDLELIDVNQSMPVFEGFIVDAQADSGELDFAADEIDFDKLNLPRTTIERASILAEICRSASLDTPLSHFSSAFVFRGTQNLYHSVPNDLLESLDVRSTFPLNSDADKQFQSGNCVADDYKDTFEGMPCSDYLAYSGTRYGRDSRNQHASPVGKLWDRLSSHTGSSEKRLSSNPELTCFPIEEDRSISEENKTADENADDIQEEIDSSLANPRGKRQPLKDLTNSGLNPPLSVAKEKTLGADSVDFVSTKFSITGTQDKVQWSPKDQYRNKRETMEKQTSSIGATDGSKYQNLSVGTNGIKKAKESINNSISKPILPKKTSLKRQEQKLSMKESRRNNIVSNVSSFIPLIQQKQAAAVCAGKRDVKVKALEAAGAAKRLEEKRENERKTRKEALKLERAKLEEKNFRNMELEKKKKEEERKKKDADIITKKRLREEEERTEKEKKKMRIEARQRQKEQEEKIRAQKAEKGKQRSKNEQMNSKKEFHNDSKKQQNRETIRGDYVGSKGAEAKSTPTEVVMNYEECGTSRQDFEAGKEMHIVDKSPKNEDLIVQKSQAKSYEISPYQCSDDEDEEDDELPTKKYMPSWASKSSVALLLPLQQEMDPDTIFPPESFCSMDEVLLPRKLQQKQVAA